MNNVKAVLSGMVVAGLVLTLSACGSSMPTKPSKPTEAKPVNVGEVTLNKDSKGNLVVTRKGVAFKPCLKDCNIFVESVEIDSIKAHKADFGNETSAVTIIEYQVPVDEVAPAETDNSKVKIDLKAIRPILKTLDTTKTLKAITPKVSLVGTKAMSSVGGQPQMFKMARSSRRRCKDVPITVANGCCSYVYVTDSEADALKLPIAEDPDCAKYF